jgi:hypothetical protein
MWTSAHDFGIEQTYLEFHRLNRRDGFRGDGFQAWCRARRKSYDREYCRRNRGRWSNEKIARRRRDRQWLRELKTGNPCVDCGRIFPPEAMEWDQRPGTVKLFEVSMMVGHSRKLILEEIAKCDLVCANDHAIRTRARLLASLESIGV